MSNIAFGKFVFRQELSKQQRVEISYELLDLARKYKFGLCPPAYIYLEASKILQDKENALRQLCFELSDSPVDNTVTDLFDPEMYEEVSKGEYAPAKPTLKQRLDLVQAFFEEAAQIGDMEEIVLYLCGQGYAREEEYCNVKTTLSDFANHVFDAYPEQAAWAPDLRISIML